MTGTAHDSPIMNELDLGAEEYSGGCNFTGVDLSCAYHCFTYGGFLDVRSAGWAFSASGEGNHGGVG